MGAGELLIPLDDARALATPEVGGKAARLNELIRAGFRVPPGVCLTTAGYAAFLEEHRLEPALRSELGRKPLGEMRWEEMWDAALRLRALFLARPVPAAVGEALDAALVALGPETPLVVRSSAPHEDAPGASFAGLHESVGRVVGAAELADAVRVVWASLWSDAALLYQAELGIDPHASRMAVLIQARVEAEPSGLAFGVDPRGRADRQIVEAVPGPCSELVDGAVDPDRWVLDKATGAVVDWRGGVRAGAPDPLGAGPVESDPGETGPGRTGPGAGLLVPDDLEHLHRVLLATEECLGWPPDIEWTGRSAGLHLLQARPVTGAAPAQDRRPWYLGLRPGLRRLRALRARVDEELLPELEAEGERMAVEDLAALDDGALAGTIEERKAALVRWRAVYHDDFIPLAHGVRALGTFYDDLVRPSDPFEFVGLLRGEELRALRRNRALAALAGRLREQPELAEGLARALERAPDDPQRLAGRLAEVHGGARFLADLDALRSAVLDQELGGERLAARADVLLRHLLELARAPERAHDSRPHGPARAELEARLLAAAGPARAAEARERLALGRLSWRLRDDDNLLLGRVESQLLRALEEARRRLAERDRVPGSVRVREAHAALLVDALRAPDGGAVELPPAPPRAQDPSRGARPRQLVGQPGSPGIATGPGRHVRGADDIGRFRHGDVLLCDAIQPNMTLLVPLAAGIVERRGGMLIHGAIIARELGIPCVNGVDRALASVPDGEPVTVDGDLGLVTVGEPELRKEGVDLDASGPSSS